jgi:hypothetical protein
MKKQILITITLISLGLFSTYGIDRENPLSINLQQSVQTLGVNFTIDAPDQGLIRVELRDRNRTIVFEQTLRGSLHYKGTLNLQNLPDGHYYMEVRQSKHKVVKQIDLTRTSSRTVSIK